MTAVQIHEPCAAALAIPQPRGEVPAYELVLVAVPSAITCEQLLVKFAAGKWQLDGACERELGSVAEVLMDHAVTAASKRPASKHLHHESLSLVDFRLLLTPRTIVVEVWDSSTEAPNPFPVSTAEDGGYDFPGRGRRVMWCAVRTRLAQEGAGLDAPAGIPRRERLQGPARASVAMQDPQLLQRVLSGLRALDAGGKPGTRRP